jgi:hypothetical protein
MVLWLFGLRGNMIIGGDRPFAKKSVFQTYFDYYSR